MTENLPEEKAVDIKKLISGSIDAIRRRDALTLRKISADALSEAVMEGHRELILLALVDYALSKIMSKVHYTDVNDKFYGKILKHFEAARDGSKREMLKQLELIEDIVIKLDEKEGHFSDNIIEKAKIKKAAKLYDQGLSLKRASEMTGADPTLVLDYVGNSKIHEFKGTGRNANRLKIAREVFG